MAVIFDPRTMRFELEEHGKLAFADRRDLPGVWIIPHVEAHPALRGTGAAGRLMDGVIAAARAEGVKLRPTCPYADAYLRRVGADDLRG